MLPILEIVKRSQLHAASINGHKLAPQPLDSEPLESLKIGFQS